MRLTSRWAALALATAALAPLGCTAPPSESSATNEPAVVPGPDTKLSFDRSGTLTLAPGELSTIVVRTSPPGAYSIALSLLGDSLNASLDHATVVASEQGHGAVVLRAPDLATTFRLRASLERGPSAELAVSVSDEGFGVVHVLPIYAGKRSIQEWTASVVARTTCAALASTLPGEAPGALVATAPGDSEPVVENAPVGPSLAVALRAGHAAWGCTNQQLTAAGGSVSVKVTVLDKPLALEATDLDVTFGYAPDPLPYQAILAGAVDKLKQAVASASDSEATDLLDAMAEAAPPSDADLFASARAEGQWDAALESAFAEHDVRLRKTVAGWIELGLASELPIMSGRLTATSATEPGQARLKLTMLGSVKAARAGVPAQQAVAWTTQPGDVVLLSGTVPWSPTRYIAAVAAKQAKAALGASSVPTALAQVADCQAIGQLTGGYAGCTSSCMAALCASALSARWYAVLDAATSHGEITLAASAAATCDDAARPTAFTGTWIGAVTDGEIAASVQGAVIGALPAPP
jgi:hypothetical protein